MTRGRRIALNPTLEERRLLERMAKEYRPYQPVSTTLLEILLHRVTTCNNIPNNSIISTQATDAKKPGTPLATHAPDQNRSLKIEEKKEEKKKKKRRVAPDADLFPHPLSAVFDSLDWYGAKLPQSVTSSDFLTRVERECAGVDIEAELVKASNWLMANPHNRKTHLAPFLLGWLRRSKTPPVHSGAVTTTHTLSPTGSTSLDCNDPRWMEAPKGLEWMMWQDDNDAKEDTNA